MAAPAGRRRKYLPTGIGIHQAKVSALLTSTFAYYFASATSTLLSCLSRTCYGLRNLGIVFYSFVSYGATSHGQGSNSRGSKLSKSDPAKAEAIYKDTLSKGPGSGEAALRDYETALMDLGELYRDTRQADKLADLVTRSTSALSSLAKAKTAKLGMYQISIRVQLLLTILSSSAARSLCRHT